MEMENSADYNYRVLLNAECNCISQTDEAFSSPPPSHLSDSHPKLGKRQKLAFSLNPVNNH